MFLNRDATAAHSNVLPQYKSQFDVTKSPSPYGATLGASSHTPANEKHQLMPSNSYATTSVSNQ